MQDDFWKEYDKRIIETAKKLLTDGWIDERAFYGLIYEDDTIIDDTEFYPAVCDNGDVWIHHICLTGYVNPI